MKKYLLGIIKKNKFLYSIAKLYLVIVNFLIPIVTFNLKKKIRALSDNKSYSKLKTFKNIHVGQRCFIVATGPSLNLEDLEKLNGEFTFSMNSIVLSFKNTKWRPTYYGIQDEHVYKKIKFHVDNSGLENMFFADNIKKKISIPPKAILFPLNFLNHNIYHRKYNSKFSKDIYLEVFDGYTITYSLLQIAVYMGFSEIYLIGADTNYNKAKTHFIDYGHSDPGAAQAGYKMIQAYKVAKRHAEENNIKIFNATRGGMLEVFPRVDLDEVLSIKESNDFVYTDFKK